MRKCRKVANTLRLNCFLSAKTLSWKLFGAEAMHLQTLCKQPLHLIEELTACQSLEASVSLIGQSSPMQSSDWFTWPSISAGCYQILDSLIQSNQIRSFRLCIWNIPVQAAQTSNYFQFPLFSKSKRHFSFHGGGWLLLLNKIFFQVFATGL